MGDLAKKKTLQEIEDLRNQIIQDAIALDKQMYELRELCKQMSDYMYHDVHKTMLDNYFRRANENDLKQLIHVVDKKAWELFIDTTRIKEVASRSSVKKIDEDLEKNVPVFSVETAQTFLGDIKNKYVETASNTIQEVFEYFTNSYYKGSSWNDKKYCNNRRLEKTFRCSAWIWVNEYTDKFDMDYKGTMFVDLEKVCHILDNKSILRYPETIDDKIKKVEWPDNTVENDYFKITLYKKGNQKVSFKRLDILEKINKYGGGLKPELFQ